MNIEVLTLFPEMMDQIFSFSIVKRAREKGLLNIHCHQIRDFADNKHGSVDDYPYGGGCGMVMTPQPIFDAHEFVLQNNEHIKSDVRTIYCTPKGQVFSQELAIELAKEESLIFLCGHYEGVDQRVIDELVTDEISIGDYVLTGGELPTAVMVDAISRMIPGVLREDISFQEESLFDGLLEYPHYTRPADFRGLKVPEVLLSGHHKKIQEWRHLKAIRETYLKRPDIIKPDRLTDKDVELINRFKMKE